MADLRNKKHHSASEKIILLAAKALQTIAQNGLPLDDYLDKELASSEYRRAVSSLLFTYFRKKLFIDRQLESCFVRPPAPALLALLQAALTLALFQEALAKESVVNIAVDAAKKHRGQGAGKFVNAVLRKCLREYSEAALPGNLNLIPLAVRQAWQQEFAPETVAKLGALFQTPAPASVRLRSNFDTDLITKFAGQIMELEFDSPWTFFETPQLAELIASGEFKSGAFYIQDPAPAAVITLLKAAQWNTPVKVLDMCAAPGGKLLMAAEYLHAGGVEIKRLTALDRSPRRQQMTARNLERCKLDNVQIITGDAAKYTDKERFDLVMLDVPCSNSGVFRRRPDALHSWSRDKMDELAALQSQILDNAALLCAENGYILYSSCSLETAENSAQIEAFSIRHNEFEVVDQKLFLPGVNSDGTFAALLRRRS